MLTKALEEIAKKLIERATSSRHGWAVLFLFAIMVGGFLIVREFRTSPETTAALIDPWFLTIVWIAGTIALTYAIWNAQVSSIVRLALAAIVTVSSSVGWWSFIRNEPTAIRVDIVFDTGAGLSAALTADFFATLQQEHIVVTVVSRNLSALSAGNHVEFAEVEKALSPLLRPDSVTTHTAFVTPKQLSGFGWDNLFYVTSPRLSVVSTYGILPEEERKSQLMLLKYLASMAPLVALHGQALKLNKQLLSDRDPATEHGCLHDFSVDKMLLMEKLRRGPKMCPIEEAEISKVFGAAIATEYRKILSDAAAASSP